VILRLSPAAEADVEGVLAWYRERGHDLGDQFLQALGQCFETIERAPLAFAIVHRDLRRALLRRFPYCVFYLVSEQEIVVLACLHGHRDPEAWKSRRDT
jgi:plasmid stabilization system protein ParE